SCGRLSGGWSDRRRPPAAAYVQSFRGGHLADGSQLAVANYAGCEQRSGFAGFARYGFARSQHRYIWGVRLVLLTDLDGVPLGYTLVPANEHEFEPLADL